MRRDLKKPSDYPQFFFRLRSQEEKDELEAELELALKYANRALKKGKKPFGKGEVLRTALQEGLKLVKQGRLKLPD